MSYKQKPVAIFHWLPYQAGDKGIEPWQHDLVDADMLDKMIEYCRTFKMGGILRPRRFWIERLPIDE